MCLIGDCTTMAVNKSQRCNKHGTNGLCTVRGCVTNANAHELCKKHGGGSQAVCTLASILRRNKSAASSDSIAMLLSQYSLFLATAVLVAVVVPVVKSSSPPLAPLLDRRPSPYPVLLPKWPASYAVNQSTIAMASNSNGFFNATEAAQFGVIAFDHNNVSLSNICFFPPVRKHTRCRTNFLFLKRRVLCPPFTPYFAAFCRHVVMKAYTKWS
jgi:hypothetical protein